MKKAVDYQYLLDYSKKIVDKFSSTPEVALQEICDLLHSSIYYYNWVGYYFANHEKKLLDLVTFAGEPTEHTQIAFGKGICGQVAISNKNFIVPDVRAQENYIACSIKVKSEIVIPLIVNNKNIGQIDIDSHYIDAFTPEDETFLVALNNIVASLYS